MSLLLIFVDALAYEYLAHKSLPFLNDVLDCGFCTKLETQLGYSAGIHASIWTGTTPRTHGKWTQYYYEPHYLKGLTSRFADSLPSGIMKTAIKMTYQKLTRRDPGFMPGLPPRSSYLFSGEPWLADLPENYMKHFEGKVLRIPTLFDILRENDFPYSYSYYNGSISCKANIMNALKSLKGKNRKVHVVFTNIIDEAGHKLGPHSPEIDEELTQLDSSLLDFANEIDSSVSHTIVFSDHGMTAIKKTLNIQNLLKDSHLTFGENYLAFHDATMSRFWYGNNSVKDKLISVLDAIPFGRVLTENDLKLYGVDFESSDRRRFGELIFLADPGVYVFPNYLQCLFSNYHKAAHGYDPKHKSSYGAFLYRGPLTDRFKRAKEMSVIDLLPTIFDLLDLPTPATCEGVSALERKMTSDP